MWASSIQKNIMVDTFELLATTAGNWVIANAMYILYFVFDSVFSKYLKFNSILYFWL